MHALQNTERSVRWRVAPGQEIHVEASPIFPITPYSRFLLRHLPAVGGKEVLDFGAGCGILGIAAASRGATSVLSCDVSSEALELTLGNARRNGIDQLRVQLVTPNAEHDQVAHSSVDVIVSNPASLPTLIDGREFWSGGRLGNRMILALIEVAANSLRTDGVLRFVHTSLASLASSFHALTQRGFAAAIIAVERIPFRTHYAPLMEYFTALRGEGQIAFDGNSIYDAFEYLYLIDARRAFHDIERGKAT